MQIGTEFHQVTGCQAKTDVLMKHYDFNQEKLPKQMILIPDGQRGNQITNEDRTSSHLGSTDETLGGPLRRTTVFQCMNVA